MYNVNVPLVPALLEGEMPPVRFTTMAERVYGRLFTPIEVERSEKQREAGRAGPSAVAKGADDDEGASSKHHARVGEEVQFKFAPGACALYPCMSHHAIALLRYFCAHQSGSE